MRVHGPDDPKSPLAGTALPEPVLKFANGDVVRGQALCDAINDDDRSTLHNAYLFMFTNRQFGPLLVLRGKAAAFRASGPDVRPAGASQVRDWSICSGEGMSTTETPDDGCAAVGTVRVSAD